MERVTSKWRDGWLRGVRISVVVHATFGLCCLIHCGHSIQVRSTSVVFM